MGSAVAGEATLAEGDEHAVDPRAGHDVVDAGALASWHPRRVHRWHDLDRRDRIWALAVAAALLMAPVVAFIWFLPDWAPAGDPALMGLRALDVGTSRTPLLGQPSTSGLYSEAGNVHHPGALHFYLMALPVRLLDGAVGMSLTSVLITGTCLVVSAWAVFRQLGRAAGLLAAAILAGVAFTTGASSLINPVSSSIAGYPLLVATVLLWCVVCGDARLLPAATVAVSFTAQQHLSVVPATAVLTVGALALAAVSWGRSGRWGDPAGREDLVRWGRWSALAGLVLWAPALAQQVVGNVGNLGQMVWFARHGNGDTLGYPRGTWQLAHALGLPPLLGRNDVTGTWLISRPDPLTWTTAGAVLLVVAVACLRWRSTHPRRASLGPMVALISVAGLVNGSSVPKGPEQQRLPFYHWTFVLAFFVALIVGLAVADPLRRWRSVRSPARPVVRYALRIGAVALVAAPSILNVGLDRRTNTAQAAYGYVRRDLVDAAADGVSAHADELGDHILVLARNQPLYSGISDAVMFELAERGLGIKYPLTSRFFVHDQHLVDRDQVDGGIVLLVDRVLPADAPDGGELVAAIDLAPDARLDVTSLDALIAQAESADDVRLGPEMERALAALSPELELLLTAAFESLADNPRGLLMNPLVLEQLRDHQLEHPALDPRLAARVLDSLDDGDPVVAGQATRLRVYLLDRDEVLRQAFSPEVEPA